MKRINARCDMKNGLKTVEMLTGLVAVYKLSEDTQWTNGSQYGCVQTLSSAEYKPEGDTVYKGGLFVRSVH